MSTKETVKTLDNSEYICGNCGKHFYVWSSKYVYKCSDGHNNRILFCGWNCQKAWERSYPTSEELKRIKDQAVFEKKLEDDAHKCQWTRFHDKWIKEQLERTTNISSIHRKFNKEFLLNIPEHTFRNHVKILTEHHNTKKYKNAGYVAKYTNKNKEKNNIPVFTRMQWTRFHHKWITENINNFETIESMLRAFNEKFLTEVKYDAFWKEYSAVKEAN